MSKPNPEPAKVGMAHLLASVRPELDDLLDANQNEVTHEQRVMTAIEALQRDPVTQRYALSITANTIVKQYDESTTTFEPSLDQLDIFDSEDDVRHSTDLANFKCGDGSLIRQNYITERHVLAWQQRRDKHAHDAFQKAQEGQRYTDAILPYFRAGMTHPEARAALWKKRKESGSL